LPDNKQSQPETPKVGEDRAIKLDASDKDEMSRVLADIELDV